MAQPYVTPPPINNDARFTNAATPAGWFRDNIVPWFNGAIDTIMRGRPAPYSPQQAYPTDRQPPVKQPQPNGGWQLILTRRYDRGAYAYGVRGGALTYDPIGGGVVTTRPMDPTAPAAIKVPFGDAIFWAPQPINYGITPASGAPLYTPDQLAAMLGNPALAGGNGGLAQYIAPGDAQGFGS